ncbi:MAG: molybdopterin molybdotransferase MoeA [Planctomycetaceae bacterium]|nr:molybdopterin molybdotransferase MoeA [Planctomycetaceae bacterium]
MLTVEEALNRIVAETQPLESVMRPLSEALGLVLAEDVVSDCDSPPFDKSLMDGFAIRCSDVRGPETLLQIVGELTAGRVSDRPLASGEALRIMTGATIPQGADAVVRIEDAVVDGPNVRFTCGPVAVGKSIFRQGESMRRGETVVPAGRLLRPQELGLLAELGRATVRVVPTPRVAVLATGDELVPVDQTPGPGQIRNSNETMLRAQLGRAGCDVHSLGIARDNEQELEAAIRKGLEFDMLCLSGGVSMGKLDLVPATLAKCGVREVLHKVFLKPGKPVWFGVYDPPTGPRRCIFGLPGNPVSSMVCCELFVQTAVRVLAGRTPPQPVAVPARLAVPHSHRDDRPTFIPAFLETTANGPLVTPVAWKGSADLRATVNANALIFMPAGAREYDAGTKVDVYNW